jgi:endo-1,4-beta-D-glucanase Y
MLKEIWDKDIDGAGTLLPKGGSNYQSPTGTGPWQITSASYFAPSFYRVFASVDTDASHDWAGVIAAVYEVINGPISGSNGLIPAWCGNSCTVAANNGMATDGDYQYDSHRIPMRIGLDYCFNGTVEARTYANLITKFFAGLGKAGLGIGQIADKYTPSGVVLYASGANSASVLGTAAVGAMASGEQSFLDDAYQTVFDVATRGTMAPMLYHDPSPTPDPLPTYSYYNATVGLLTLLIMTGNFLH